MKSKKPFLINERLRSFRYAFEGIVAFIRQEHNVHIHLTATLLVIILSILFPVSRMEAIGLTIVTGFVWVTEIINTAIEKTMDFISTEEEPQIKFIKDVAAGSVLLASIVAVIVGCLIFIPKL